MDIVELKNRDKSHGVYSDRAKLAVAFKNLIRNALNRRRTQSLPELTADQIEALDMITHKISRILVGDPNLAEHWNDIIGYSMLVVAEIEEAMAQIDKAAADMARHIENESNS